MSTWAEWREKAKAPFKDGERVRMEGGKAYRAQVPQRIPRARIRPSPPREMPSGTRKLKKS